jgi:hypothetical protein
LLGDTVAAEAGILLGGLTARLEAAPFQNDIRSFAGTPQRLKAAIDSEVFVALLKAMP